jgi:PAS domain S-box-containing protein
MNYREETMPSSAQILIVEDELIVAMDIGESIKSLGYKVAGIASASEDAVKYAVERKPDLILMDIRIKGTIDGIETAKKIIQITDIPIIYLTAFADTETLQRAKLTQPFGYILKPFDKKSLHTTIEMALYKHYMERRVKNSERWLSATLNSMGDAMIATNAEGEIIFMNPVAEILTGWLQPEAMRKNIAEVLTIIEGEDQNKKVFPVDLVNQLQARIYLNGSIYLRSKAGKEISILGTASPLMDEHNKIHGVVLVFQDITEQRKIEEEKERLFKRVSAAQERLKTLSSRLMEVQEMERRALARELHDEIGQILTAIKINLQMSSKFIGSADIESHLQASIELTEEALKHVRSLSLDLRPSMLDDLGLIPALRWFIDRQSQRTGIDARLIAQQLDRRLSPQYEITCYRITQEAITNVIRHAGVGVMVVVELWLEGNELHLKISDNGKGFEVYTALQNAVDGKSMGIIGMQERVELLGGSLKINSKSGKGTDIHAVFNLEEIGRN